MLAASSLPSIAAPRDYRIDPEHASFGFLVSHIGYQNVLGMFREVAGSFRFDEENQDDLRRDPHREDRQRLHQSREA